MLQKNPSNNAQNAPPSLQAEGEAMSPAQQAQSALRLKGVSKSFSGVDALRNVDLDIREGEFVSLIGPSGCGKSTLLQLAGHFLPPSAGSLEWYGADFNEARSKGRIATTVFQEPTLLPWLTIIDNVRLPLRLKGKISADDEARVQAALAQVGLGQAHKKRPHQLSGGMRMRASLARSMVVDPTLLMMDEPFGALDEFTRNRLDADLLDLWAEKNLTIIFVTHSIYEAVFLSSRVIVMAANPGRVFKDIKIDGPKKRDDAFRLSDSFAEQTRALSLTLHEASLASSPG